MRKGVPRHYNPVGLSAAADRRDRVLHPLRTHRAVAIKMMEFLQ